MRLLFLTPSRRGRPPSGGDLYGRLLRRALRRRGHRVEVAQQPPSLAALARAGHDVVLQDELGFARWTRLNQALEARGVPVRRVALVHVTTAKLRPQAGTAPAEAAFLASTHAALFVSQQVRLESLRLLRAASPGLRGPLARLPTFVVPPGADRLGPPSSARRAPSPRPRSGLRLLCVGHLARHKGQLELLRAFVEARAPGLHLTLVGSGEVEPGYTRRVEAALRGIPRARWVGPAGPARLRALLAGADACLGASPYESWGMALAEAQAAGLPVVAWTRGGLWEFLEAGRGALKVRTARAAFAALADGALVARLRRGAAAAARRARGWAQVGAEVEAALLGLGGGR